jgi:glycosyltransferase involved in cell wall biosynthesis
MVLAPISENRPAVWADRQIESLRTLGVEVRVYLFKERRSLGGLVSGGLDIRRQAREFEADLVHVHFGAAQAVVSVVFSDRPVIISFCGSDLLGNYNAGGRRTWSGRLSGALSRIGAMGCHRTIAKSEELRRALWLSRLRNKCEVIPNGVDLDLFRPAPRDEARAALGWHHRDPVVLFMDRKGAWVKDPALAHAVYEAAKKKVGALRLYVLENESPKNMPLLYNAADALLVTSRHEGSNNTIKEALACNLPVVATACGDAHERLAGVRNSYVCTRDPYDLAQRIEHIVSRRERSNGRDHIQGLSLERIAIRIKQTYQKVLSETQKHACLTVRAD